MIRDIFNQIRLILFNLTPKASRDGTSIALWATCSSFSHEATKGSFILFPKTFQKVAKNQNTYLPTLVVIKTPNHFRAPALGSGTWMWCQGQMTKSHLPVQGDLLLPLALHQGC